MIDRARPFVTNADEAIWQTITANTRYYKLNFNELHDFTSVVALIQTEEAAAQLPGNRLLYLATAAHFFCAITEHSAQSGLATRKRDQETPWHRIMYEKPFGQDLASAHKINECIADHFDESQIYRVDHFLTKELVSNIALMRFTNLVFEPLWNNNYIEQVQIILSETIAIEGRGSYYDAYGALADVVQNHMLELLALIAMEPPRMLTGDFIRAQRAKVLEAVQVKDGILGQYEGYLDEPQVAPNSKTDTFAALALTINNPRWQGVPFYFKTGKGLDKKETVIHIKFKNAHCLLTRGCPTDSNWLTINVAPEATFSLSLNAKKPGSSDEVVPVAMDFCHSCIFGDRAPEEAYEVVFDEVMRGEQSSSVRFDEIEYAWRVIDVIHAKQLPMFRYQQGSSGPDELKEFETQHGMKWKS